MYKFFVCVCVCMSECNCLTFLPPPLRGSSLSLYLFFSLPSLYFNFNIAMRLQFDSSDCGGTFAHPPLHCNSRVRETIQDFNIIRLVNSLLMFSVLQHIHMLAEERSTSISERCTRSRINSAIFVSSEGRGFDSIEFLRRHGSQSVLCRKAKSAENITDNGRRVSSSFLYDRNNGCL